jgi:hypothetical protein
MSKFAFLEVSLNCPYCDSPIDDADLVGFQWGYCRAATPWSNFVYKVGDEIRWRTCKDGSTPSWTYFEDIHYDSPNDLGGANIGEPSVRDLVVRDTDYYSWDVPCKSCHQPFGGAAVRILNGVIETSWVYRPKELSSEVAIYLVEADGILNPKPEWNNHSMGLLRNC